MAGRTSFLFTILTFLLLNKVVAQGTEEQRKYLITNEAVLPVLFGGQTNLGGVRLIHHSTDTYYDIYLDSPDLILKKKGYSLRFRRRHSNDTTITYSLQLKSEMTDLTGIRMEVEEQELDFYRILKDTVWVSLTAILDPLFNYSVEGKMTEAVNYSLDDLGDWIQFKSGAPVLPFQQLKAIDTVTFSNQTIGSFRPVLAGKSERSRFHGVYEPTAEQPKISMNRLSESSKPLLIRKDPELNWVLEASYDNSTFRAISDADKTVNFTEFEAENKYFIPETGRTIMNAFEKAILNELHFSPSKESKYIRATESLLHK